MSRPPSMVLGRTWLHNNVGSSTREDCDCLTTGLGGKEVSAFPCSETDLLTSSVRLRGIPSLASQPISCSLFSSSVEQGDEGGAKMPRSLPSQRTLEDIRKEARG